MFFYFTAMVVARTIIFGSLHGNVIKQFLLLDHHQLVAVKKLDSNGFQGEREFLTETLILQRHRHPNIVRLIGYCAEGSHRLLVYEYMPLGCLEDHLLGKYFHCPWCDCNKHRFTSVHQSHI